VLPELSFPWITPLDLKVMAPTTAAVPAATGATLLPVLVRQLDATPKADKASRKRAAVGPAAAVKRAKAA